MVESILYAWRFTHDQKWQDYAEKNWNAIAKHCEVATGGFTDVRHVTRIVSRDTELFVACLSV